MASAAGLPLYNSIYAHPATRAKLLPHGWNQRQAVDASHFVVFAARTAMTEAENVASILPLRIFYRGPPQRL